MSSNILNYLRCPKTGASLQFEKDTLKSARDEVRYPLTGGIPWLYREPYAALADWQNRIDFQMGLYNKEIHSIKHFQKDRLSGEVTKKRVNRLLQGHVEHNRLLAKLMAPLGDIGEAQVFLHEAVRTKAPLRQSMMSYHANIFRDWVWGDAENKIALNIMKRELGSYSPKSILTLGAGAGRLSVDLHVAMQAEISILMDINPYLAFCGKEMIAGRDFQLYEFPLAPLTDKDVAVLQKFTSPYGKLENIHYVFGDALNPPMAKGSFDCVVTPWFIDIVPMDFKKQARLVNHLLKPGGVWLNFGSLVFHSKDPFLCYSPDEISEILREKDGFSIDSLRRESVPYLQSPHSAQKRLEDVLIFAARKDKALSYAEEFYHHLPVWLRQDDQPIPELPFIQNLVMVNFIFAELLASVSQGVTIQSLGEALASKLNVTVDQGKEMMRTLLVRTFEENS